MQHKCCATSFQNVVKLLLGYLLYKKGTIMKSKSKFRVIILFILAILFFPTSSANALPKISLPPADLFQLPWEQNIAWVSLDGFDHGWAFGGKRGPNSPHLYTNGGAVDFAPRKDMRQGEDTSDYWVTAAAAGTVIKTSFCHLVISHPGGWITEYQFLAKMQVSVGEAVYRNQRLGIIASGTASQRFCPPVEDDIPHVHFSLRPNMELAAFAGWEVNYNPLFNKTTFIKNGETAYQYDPLLNTPLLQIAMLGDITFDITYTGGVDKYRYEKWHFVLTDTTSFSLTATPTTAGLKPLIILLDVNGNELARGVEILTSTQPAGDYFVQIQPQEGQGFYNLILKRAEDDNGSISVVASENVKVGEKITVTVYFNKVPAEGYESAEITCSYDAYLLRASDMSTKSLFGTTPVTAVNGPQNGSFIYAIAGSHGQEATTNGAVFSFEVTGLKEGQSTIECLGRVSLGDGTLTDIGSDNLVLNILESAPIASTSSLPNPDSSAPSLTGQVLASKPITVSLYNEANLLVVSAPVQADGTFTLIAPAGKYTIITEANGFINAHGSAIFTTDGATSKPIITLLAGDIDNNNIIDQLDAMTIAMNYNTASPYTADLNGEGIINVLDLEILAQNYRFSGVLIWE